MENHFTQVCERRSRIGHIGTDDERSNTDTDDRGDESSGTELHTDSEYEENPSYHYAASVKKRAVFREGRLPKSPGKEVL
jgi:hypothetical protein